MRLIRFLLGVVVSGLTGACAPSLDLQLYTGPRLPSTAEALLLHKGSACPVVTLVMAHDDAFIGKLCQADPPVTVCTSIFNPARTLSPSARKASTPSPSIASHSMLRRAINTRLVAPMSGRSPWAAARHTTTPSKW